MRWLAGLQLIGVACDRRPPSVPGSAIEVRVVSWNVEGLGAPADPEYEAVLAVLARIDADVVALNEIDTGENEAVDALGDALGYEARVVPDDNPFGTLHNAMLTRFPLEAGAFFTSPDLSGDDLANDLTRLPVAMSVSVGSQALTVAVNHLKSGFYEADAFRRVVDAGRTAQAAAEIASGPIVVCGDLNAELADAAPDQRWFDVPEDVPLDYRLGADLASDLATDGVAADPFAPITSLGLVRAPAAQRDGQQATRDSSGRVIDHVYVDATVRVLGAEVYDARDDALAGRPLAGDPPSADATAVASDHFPVFVDLELSAP